MIKYHIKNEIVTMDLVDLEHCGFDHELFDAELAMAGVTKLGAKWPVMLAVNFTGGHAITEKDETAVLKRLVHCREQFDKMIKKLTGEEQDQWPTG